MSDQTVRGFGYEWTRFDQSERAEEDLRRSFAQYFSIFPWAALTEDAVGMDLGCGSGRWARFAAERVGMLFCVDPSREALEVAGRNLAGSENCVLVESAAGELPFRQGSMDFCYSLGVLHHTLDPAASLADAVRALKPGAPVLLYLYYDLEDRPLWFRTVWRSSDILRRFVSESPTWVRYAVSQSVALTVYLPLSVTAQPVSGTATVGSQAVPVHSRVRSSRGSRPCFRPVCR